MSTRRAAAARTFPAQPACVAEARTWAIAFCRSRGVGAAACEAVRLLVSEVFTNAIKHTDSVQVAVRILIGTSAMEVCVDDAGSRPPRPRRAGPGDTDGRGLTLVDALAEAWGTRPLAGGKRVWFRIALSPARERPPLAE